jgi:hypothetical protein
MSDNIDPENLGSFMMPESMLEKIFDLSGDANHGKGFILAFVDQSGKPLIFTRAQSQVIEMGLRKAVERYLTETEEIESMYNHFGDEDITDSI